MRRFCPIISAIIICLCVAATAEASSKPSYLALRKSAGLWNKAHHQSNGSSSTQSSTNGNGSGASNGTISGGGLTKSGSGTLTLSGSNTYTGGTTINSGSLGVGSG